MKRAFGSSLLLMVLLFCGAFLFSRTSAEAQPLQQNAVETFAENAATHTDYVHDDETTLRVLCGNTVEDIPLHDYLCGVVRGEMLPTFSEAALCAQAAAERTYIYYQLSHGGKAAHPQADVCTDPGCCNAYLSETVAKEKWGDLYEQYNAVIEKAVRTTDGQVVLYEDSPILAVFHSSSAGTTASSGDVWTADLPYLISVESPESGSNVPNYYSVNTYSVAEFTRIFKLSHPSADFSAAPENWIRDPVTDGDRVDHITVGGVTVTGKELRSLFGLRSTAFSVDCTEDTVTFHVIGYGHGVGMSQYGADELGREGKTWQEILQWYYTDTTVGYYQGK